MEDVEDMEGLEGPEVFLYFFLVYNFLEDYDISIDSCFDVFLVVYVCSDVFENFFYLHRIYEISFTSVSSSATSVMTFLESSSNCNISSIS